MNRQTYIGLILTATLYTLFFDCLILWNIGIAGLAVFLVASVGFLGGTVSTIYFFTGDTNGAEK